MIFLSERGEVSRAIDLLKSENPKEYVNRGSHIEKRLLEIHLKGVGCKVKYPFDSFELPDDIKEVLSIFERQINIGETKTLVIKGNPGTGKTEFLKAYFEQKLGLPVLVINHKEGLKNWDISKHKAIIYDDPQFKELTRKELIALMDYNSQSIKIRYTMGNIPSNTPKALALNTSLYQCNTAFEDEAVQRRRIVYQLDKKDSLIPEIPDFGLDADDPQLKDKVEAANEYEDYRRKQSRDKTDTGDIDWDY